MNKIASKSARAYNAQFYDTIRCHDMKFTLIYFSPVNPLNSLYILSQLSQNNCFHSKAQMFYTVVTND